MVAAPKVKTVLESMQKLGCRNTIKAVHCENKQQPAGRLGEYGFTICSNNMGCDRDVEQTVLHQLIHAFDYCRAAYSNSAHIHRAACWEIRAFNLSTNCEPACVKRKAMIKVMAMPMNYSEAEAKSAVEAMWDSCSNDTTPFDKRPS